MAKDEKKEANEAGEKTVVVGLVQRVFGVKTKLQYPPSQHPEDTVQVTPKKPAKGNLRVEAKVMEAPRKKATSIKTMSDFKV